MISEVTSQKVLEFTLLIVASSMTILLYRRWKTTPSLPPGPSGLPVLGYLPFIGKNLPHEFAKLAQRFGPIFTLQLGSNICIIITSSDLAKAVVHDQANIFANIAPPLVDRLLKYNNKGITLSDNKMYWRNMRKVMVFEIMSNKNMEASLSLRKDGVRKTIKHVYESMGTGVNIADSAFSTSLSVVTSLVLGKSLDQDEQNHNLGEDRLQDVITRLINLLGAQKISGFLPILARLDLQGVQEKINCKFQKFDEILQRIIDDRLSVKSKESTDKHGRKDFLQILLELRQQNSSSSYSIPQIKALLVVVFVAGTDTSASMVEWAMAELLKYPEVMKKTREELEQVIGLDTIVEESHLPILRYLDAVIKEALRLHPPLPFLIRQSPNESCKVGEYTIPKGLNIYLNIWAIQRDPQYWENPSEFNPKRFLNTDEYVNKFKYNGSNTNFLPFGSGRRICPGIPMGEKMFMYLLASLVHSFHWTLPDPKELELSDEFGFLLKKRNPLVAIPSQRLANKHLYM